MTIARVTVDPATAIGPVHRRLFGSFVEHLGRCVYTGLLEPGHPTADEHGFRRDVLELVHELGVTTIRYPGGNFVSGYRWEDGVGPVDERPARLDLAWHSLETNAFGLDEFMRWSREAGTETMLAVNLGTRGVQEALDLLEYCNVGAPSAVARQRVDNGSPDPHDIRMWCLGNEMDGPWQLGHRSADEYGRLAAQTARAMRQLDPRVELVVCGSSGAGMPTFGEWERAVLDHTYDLVDFISCHAYYEPVDGDRASFLASGVDMARFIETVVGIADEVGAAHGSDKRLAISFDEWNVWYLTHFESDEKITEIDTWPVAPRLLENVYTVTDAVVVGGLLITLLRHADRVTAASLAQLVNVIAPIMTEPGGPAWRQTIFHPFALAARLARGGAIPLVVDGPHHDTDRYGRVASLDAVATLDPDGALAVFVVNRHPDEACGFEAALPAGEWTLAEAWTVSDDDPLAVNTRDEPDRVVPRPTPAAHIENAAGAGASRPVLRADLPAASWSAFRLDPAPHE